MGDSTDLNSLKALKTGSTKIGDSGAASDEIPEWYDHSKFVRGQEFFRRHVAAVGLGMHFSLVSGLSIINLLEPLVFTNASDTPDKSLKRYLLTFYHIFMWLTGDVWDTSSKAYKSMRTVRGMHKSVAKQMNAKFKDKLYVSQYDMGLVQSGFFAAVLMYPRRFGIRCTDREMEDYVYVWRVVGYSLGIEDQYNICSGSFEQIKQIVKEIEQKCALPALENPPKDFDKMADAYIDGMNKPLPIRLHSKESILTLVWEAHDRKSPYKLGLGDWIRVYQLKLMTFLMYHVPGFKNIMNYLALKDFYNRMETMNDKIKMDFVKYSNQ